MFELKVISDFSCAHSLRDYPGDCSRFHGHNWQVVVKVCASELDKVGMGVDFRDIKRVTKAVIKRLDHRYLNDISPFDHLNPTAENIAKYLYNEIALNLDREYVRVSRVEVWETKNAAAAYSES